MRRIHDATWFQVAKVWSTTGARLWPLPITCRAALEWSCVQETFFSASAVLRAAYAADVELVMSRPLPVHRGLRGREDAAHVVRILHGAQQWP